MQYVESPNLEPFKYESIFLAGGIVGCPDWQSDMVEKLKNYIELTLVNPRRKDFPINDPKAAPHQIYWEYLMLREVDMISFWFPKETVCPIVLYELGTWSASSKRIFVGVHPDYKRKIDVEIQTKLVRPEVEVVYSIEDLLHQIRKEIV